METTPITLVWVRKSAGKATWYETECGRFALTKGHKRGTWILFDRHDKDKTTPEFNRMETVYSVRHGKNKAARWAAGKTF